MHSAPTPQQMQRWMQDVYDAAAYGVEPLYMLTHWGIPYSIDIGCDETEDIHPWHDASHHLAADAEGTIHWMHPAMRAHLQGLA